MSTARLSNNGYMLISKEVTAGTPIAPAIGVPLYDETLSTNGNFQDIKPAYGNKFATHSTLPGMRTHGGDITCMFEPNTAAHLANILYTQGTSTNAAGVYTYPFTLGADSYTATIDLSLGNIVKRFWGVKSDQLSINYDKNEAQAKSSVAALGSFEGREITSVSGTGPYTIVLADPNAVFEGSPTKGLLVGDLIRFYDLATSAAVADGTVTAITNGTTFTCTISTGAMTAIGAGDAVHLRPAAPTFNNLQPFLWSKTRFYFGATATAALANTVHTPLEPGSAWTLKHDFADKGGANRSGSFDPASLDRTVGDIDLKIKKLTDTPEDLLAFKNMNKSACVIRHYSGSTNQYEFRVTINQLITDKPLGNVMKSGDLVYSNIDYHTNMNFTDGQAFDVKVLNALTTV